MVVSFFQKVVNRALAKGFQGAAFYSAVEEEVHRCVPEASRAETLATNPVDAPFFTGPIARFVKHAVSKNFLDKAEM